MKEDPIQETYNQQLIDGLDADLPDVDEFLEEMNLSYNERVSQLYTSRVQRRHGRASLNTTIIVFFFTLACVMFVIFVGNGGFGYSWFRVTSGSMQREIPEGSLIITKRMDPRRLLVNDTVTYLREDGSTVTHNIVDIIIVDGNLKFQTKGSENMMPDTELVDSKDVIGLVVFHMAGLGLLLFVIKGFFLMLSVVFVLLAVRSLVKELSPRFRNSEEKNPDKAVASA